MKKYLIIAISALAGLAYVTPSAKAASGDMYLGVRKSGVATDYLIYIGNTTNYTTGGGVYTGAQITLNTATLSSSSGPISGIGTAAQVNADLTTIFGAGWYTDSSVVFGVAGETGFSAQASATNTVFVTDPNTTTGTSLWSNNSKANEKAPASAINNLSVAYVQGQGGATASQGAIQAATGPGSTNSYYDLGPDGTQVPGSSFSRYAPSIDTGTRTNKLVEIVATNNTTASLPAGSEPVLGSFTLGSDGTITYAAAIPEPSTYAMIGIGSLVLVMWARRRRNLLVA